MIDLHRRLRKNELNHLFLEGLGNKVEWHSGEDSAPLLVNLTSPLLLKLRVYVFNSTKPPGAVSYTHQTLPTTERV